MLDENNCIFRFLQIQRVKVALDFQIFTDLQHGCGRVKATRPKKTKQRSSLVGKRKNHESKQHDSY